MDILHERLGMREMVVPCVVDDSVLQHLADQRYTYGGDEEGPPEGTTADLQFRFFFGLLAQFHGALGLEWHPSWFIQTQPDGERTVSTTALINHTIPALLSGCILPALRESWPELSEEELLTNMKRGLLGTSIDVTADFDEKTRNARLAVTAMFYESVQTLNATLKAYPPFPMDANGEDLNQSTTFKVLLAIGILYETLKEIFVSLFFMFETDEGLVSDDIEEASVNAEILMAVLQHSIAKKGWCLARTSGLGKSLSAWYLLNVLPPPEDAIHSHCQPNQCSARYVTLPPTSVSYHTSQCHGECAVLYVDNEVVVDILEGGDFPVILGPGAGTVSDVSLPIVKASVADKWIAISHVW